MQMNCWHRFPSPWLACIRNQVAQLYLSRSPKVDGRRGQRTVVASVQIRLKGCAQLSVVAWASPRTLKASEREVRSGRESANPEVFFIQTQNYDSHLHL